MLVFCQVSMITQCELAKISLIRQGRGWLWSPMQYSSVTAEYFGQFAIFHLLWHKITFLNWCIFQSRAEGSDTYSGPSFFIPNGFCSSQYTFFLNLSYFYKAWNTFFSPVNNIIWKLEWPAFSSFTKLYELRTSLKYCCKKYIQLNCSGCLVLKLFIRLLINFP